eukprot:Hpha_TRINITY_DN16214_c1_g4::TRINITY_DN16214_c1_g4_i2::g.16097::m.16097
MTFPHSQPQPQPQPHPQPGKARSDPHHVVLNPLLQRLQPHRPRVRARSPPGGPPAPQPKQFGRLQFRLIPQLTFLVWVEGLRTRPPQPGHCLPLLWVYAPGMRHGPYREGTIHRHLQKRRRGPLSRGRIVQRATAGGGPGPGKSATAVEALVRLPLWPTFACVGRPRLLTSSVRLSGVRRRSQTSPGGGSRWQLPVSPAPSTRTPRSLPRTFQRWEALRRGRRRRVCGARQHPRGSRSQQRPRHGPPPRSPLPPRLRRHLNRRRRNRPSPAVPPTSLASGAEVAARGARSRVPGAESDIVGAEV